MNSNPDPRFWSTFENLLVAQKLIVDRLKSQPHPRYPELIYPLDYGYLAGTVSSDGSGIDVWVGSLGNRMLTGILCTFDTVKCDAEIKLLAGCTEQDVEIILHFYSGLMRTLYIPKPEES
jgi:inorganic pyrophosphatase